MNRVCTFPRPHDTPAIAVFDASHGQPNWAQTGFASRELDTNFSGLTGILCGMGYECRATGAESLSVHLHEGRLLVLPPPTGTYDGRGQRWRASNASLLTPREIDDTLAFLHRGGRMLAFGYRFGDSFTQTNLRDLFGPLGCRLNNDAVVDVVIVRRTHPLELHFDTPPESLPLAWSSTGVRMVRWRPMATISILPGATVRPLALSTGGRCLSFDRTLREIRFQSLPLAVAGHSGQGRFALFGGPHVFETGPLGLLDQADNARFLRNVLDWLTREEVEARSAAPAPYAAATDNCELSHVEWGGEGRSVVETVERTLRRTGVSKALNRAKWMP